MVGPSATPRNTRWAEAYQNALITDIQVLKDRAVAKLSKVGGAHRKGGPSGPREPGIVADTIVMPGSSVTVGDIQAAFDAAQQNR